MAGPETITEEEYGSWLTPKAALEQVAKHLGESVASCHQTLLTHLVDGYIRAAARHTMIVQGTKRTSLENYRIIKPEIWERLDESNPAFSHPVWMDGTVAVAFIINRHEAAQEWKLVGVRINHTDMEKYFPVHRAPPPAPTGTVVPIPGDAFIGMNVVGTPDLSIASPPPPLIATTPAPAQTPPAAPAKHPGGAPPKDIWEKVWVEIAARLINGDLDPKQQKDIVNAILDWATAEQVEVSESTAKRHAKLLWDKVKPGS